VSTVNLYQGNSGQRRFIPEREQHKNASSPPKLPPVSNAPPKPKGALDGVLRRLDIGSLETEDFLVLAILWLLYKESGKTEMLIAMAAYLFA